MSLAPFPNFLGMRFEEVRLDYGRVSLPYRPEFNQPAGMIHGGVIASLIDTVVETASGKTLAAGNMAYRIVP